jgi:hypothetical protein
MKNKIWLVALATVALSVSGCSKKFFSDENKLDENSDLSSFGQKDYEKYGDDSGTKFVKGEKGIFSLGSEGGIFGGKSSGSKGVNQVRGDKLFAGALDVVLGLPIMVASREGGLITTDWKIDPQNPTNRYRLNIRVSGQEPYGEVKVVVLQQKLQYNNWVDQPNDVVAASHIAKSIRKKSQVVRP